MNGGDYSRLRQVLITCLYTGYVAGENGWDREVYAANVSANQMEVLSLLLGIEWDLDGNIVSLRKKDVTDERG